MKTKMIAVENNYNYNKVMVNITSEYVQLTETDENGLTTNIITISPKDFEKIVDLFNKQ